MSSTTNKRQYESDDENSAAQFIGRQRGMLKSKLVYDVGEDGSAGECSTLFTSMSVSDQSHLTIMLFYKTEEKESRKMYSSSNSRHWQ